MVDVSPAGTIPVAPAALQRAMKPFESVEPWHGIAKILVWGAGVLVFIVTAAVADDLALFLVACLLGGLCYAPWLISTHDALHHTLTGLTWFDEVVPRLISYPINWFHGTYAEVHKIHHKMNGDDLKDPERVQWTVEEYAAAGPIGRFYVRHQWFMDIFVLGGIGLIVKTVRSALPHYHVASVRRALWGDVAGITLSYVVLYTLLLPPGSGWKHLCLWLVFERITGGVLQWRAHVEHYGLWGKGRHYFETQGLACRNLKTNAFVSRYFNRLNFHSVHHAFVRVPFYKLPAAHAALKDVFAAAGTPLVESGGYLATAWWGAHSPALIGGVDPQTQTGRRLQVPV